MEWTTEQPMSPEMTDKIKGLYYVQHEILRTLMQIEVFKLALYYKFISNDSHFASWASETFDAYLEMLKKKPPSFDAVKMFEAKLEELEELKNASGLDYNDLSWHEEVESR